MAHIHITIAGQTSAFELPAEVGTEMTIGRAEDNSIPLPEAQELSPSHCRILKLEEGYAIQDNASAAGVVLDGRKIEYEMMQPNVAYTAGDVQIMLVEETAEAPAAPEAEGEAAPAMRKAQPAGERRVTTNTKPRPVTGKAAAGKAPAASKKGATPPADLATLAAQYKRGQGLSGADIVYIVVVLIAALYAGMALYSWQHDGNPLPIIFR